MSAEDTFNGWKLIVDKELWSYVTNRHKTVIRLEDTIARFIEGSKVHEEAKIALNDERKRLNTLLQKFVENNSNTR